MTKPLMTRPARNTLRDLAMGLATFFIIALLVGAVSTDAFSFDAGVSSSSQPAPQSFRAASPIHAVGLAQIRSLGNPGVLALERFEPPILAQHLSFSDRQIGLMLLAMMFALISAFICQSTRHLRRAAVTARRPLWPRDHSLREDWPAR